MRRAFRSMILATVLLAALFVAACSPAPDTEDVSPLATPSPNTPAEGQDLSPTSTPPAPPAVTPSPVAPAEGESEAVKDARADLADRLGMPAENIQVVTVEKVEWPDSSLGCPQEGQMYAQVIIPGQRIVLQAGGERYTYHAGDDNLILCENEQDTPRAGTPEAALDPEVAALVEMAKEALSDLAGVAVEDITMQSVEFVQWRDSSLGCPKPGMQYLQVITPGYRIRLEAGGQVYEYHTDQDSVIYCENPEAGEEDAVSAVNKLVTMARTDLATVAGVAENQIEVLGTQYVEWRDGSLGCPKAGQMYPQVITPGYIIRLRAGGQNYEYHSSMTQVVLCRK